MRELEARIRKDGTIRGTEVLKVDRFLNHQMDIELIGEIGKEFYRLFGGCGVNKILTIEASGIGIACITAQSFGVPVIFAKKNKTKNIAGMLKAVGSQGKALIVLPEVDQKVIKSAANIPGVKTAQVNTLNVYDILNCDRFIVAADAVKKIEEVYA